MSLSSFSHEVMLVKIILYEIIILNQFKQKKNVSLTIRKNLHLSLQCQGN